MIIALDYDNTFTRDPDFWDDFVMLARAYDHECVLVTGRSDDGIMGDEVKKKVGDLMPIVFAGREWKREAALRKGWKVDVWIDDSPEHVAPQILVGK